MAAKNIAALIRVLQRKYRSEQRSYPSGFEFQVFVAVGCVLKFLRAQYDFQSSLLLPVRVIADIGVDFVAFPI
ncbi:MAG TPA: hypothetical protein VE862_05130 [Candidatus Acidoferrum sp.]|nr:hypothetical protein [Candidatus Acidoferrum sp.]